MHLTKLSAGKILRVFMWVAGTLVGLFLLLVMIRVPFSLTKDKAAAEVAKIQAARLTMDDVTGAHLPPDPGGDADKSIAGIDANKNGIRDDVELAIFNIYPNSARTRATLLQYALALQMEFTQPVANTDTVTAVVIQQSRADGCLSDTLVPRKSPESGRDNSDMEKIDTYINFLESQQLNTDIRKNARNNFYKYLGSYSESADERCDIDSSKLPN